MNSTLEERVQIVYRELKEILKDDGIPPSVRANGVQALAIVWQMVSDLALDYEMLYDFGA